MFALLISPVNSLPTVVNTQSQTFVDLTFAGYKVEKQGSKKNIEREYEERMEEFVNELELNDDETN